MIAPIVIIFLLFIAIDIPYLTYFNSTMINNMLNRINQGKEVDKKRTYLAGFLVYLVMALGLYFFVIKDHKGDNLDTIRKAMFFGFIFYTFYDMTNLASIANFGLKDAIVDILWGTFLCGIVSFLFVSYFSN